MCLACSRTDAWSPFCCMRTGVLAAGQFQCSVLLSCTRTRASTSYLSRLRQMPVLGADAGKERLGQQLSAFRLQACWLERLAGSCLRLPALSAGCEATTFSQSLCLRWWFSCCRSPLVGEIRDLTIPTSMLWTGVSIGQLRCRSCSSDLSAKNRTLHCLYLPLNVDGVRPVTDVCKARQNGCNRCSKLSGSAECRLLVRFPRLIKSATRAVARFGARVAGTGLLQATNASIGRSQHSCTIQPGQVLAERRCNTQPARLMHITGALRLLG